MEAKRRQFSHATETAVIFVVLPLLLPLDCLWAQRPQAGRPETQQAPRLTLDQCISIALRNQPAIGAQRAGKGAAVELQRMAGSYFLPQLGFEARYAHIDEPRSVDFPNPFLEHEDLREVFTDAAAFFGIARVAGSAAANFALDNPSNPPFSTFKEAALDLMPDRFNVGLLGENSLTTEFLLLQPLWTGGKIRYRYQQAGLGIQAASADLAKSKQQTVFDVTRAYLGVQFARESIAVVENAIGQFRAIESLIKALLDEGDEHVTVVDLHRAGTIRLLAESEKVGLQRAADLAHEALRQAMGIEYTAEFDIADSRLIAHRRELELPAVLDEAMIRRPELAKARIGVQVAELERKLATANYLPDVALFGRFGTIDDDGGFVNPNDPEEWAVGVTLGVPLYAGGRRSAQKRQAQFGQARARYLRQLARQLITLQVQKTYLEYLEMSERLRLAETAVDQAEGTIEGLRNQFLGDQIDDEAMPDYFEDLIMARVLHTLARMRYYDIVYRYDLSLARIRLVTASNEYQNLFQDSSAGSAFAPDHRRARMQGDGAGAAGGPPLF